MPILQNNNLLYDLAILIPFFNEEKRIIPGSFVRFAGENPNILLVLINDGSNDKTPGILQSIQSQQPGNIQIFNLPVNHGKGNAIRESFLTIKNSPIPFVGYIDGDLSTSFKSFLKLYDEIKEKKSDVVLGSRIKKIDTKIERTLFRHLAGRIVATIVDTKFKIGCYDTQCGAKIFKKEVLGSVIGSPFFTRWLFDIEIILRLQKINKAPVIAEIALDEWTHKKGSKISGMSVFIVLRELFTLFKKYD